MRNILQYPMTYSEAIGILDKIQVDIEAENLVGDIRPYALRWIADKLVTLQAKELFSDD